MLIASAGRARGANVASSASAASRQVRRKASDTALLLIIHCVESPYLALLFLNGIFAAQCKNAIQRSRIQNS
jgi:hypothetical protein